MRYRAPANAVTTFATAAAHRGSAPAVQGTDPRAMIALPIPGTIPEIVEQLRTRDGQVRDLIRAGNFGAVWVPAFQAKDLAIALEPHTGDLAPRARESAEPAIQEVVRLAWLLDAFGDAGNRRQLEQAYAAFAAAVAKVVWAFAGAG